MTEPSELNSTINFELVDGLILIKASVDGTEGDFIFDTGAANTLLNKKVVDGEFTLWTANGELSSKELSLDNFEFGIINKRKIEAWAANLSYVENVIDRPLAGIIGSDIIEGYKVLIDYENQKLVILSPKTKALDLLTDEYNITHLPFKNDRGQMAVVELEVNGQDQQLIFDTGAAVSVFHSDNMKEHGILNAKDISINQIKIQEMPFVHRSIKHLNQMSNHQLDGILSVSSLNTSKILIDYNSSRIHLFWKKDKA